MKLIVDSGSTKTEWVVVDNGSIVTSIKSDGINPVLQPFQEISLSIKEKVFPLLKDYKLDAIHYYGAGCLPDKIPGMTSILSDIFGTLFISVSSDLVGAAAATCGDRPGIACILGTGSNSCFWDGNAVAKNVSPLGFILGDEGSGAVLGKILVADILKNQLPQHIISKFYEEYKLTPAEIIGHVYREPFPNRFLAGFTKFMYANLHEPEIRQLILFGFTLFFRRNVMQYDYKSFPIHFVGSVAYYFADLLGEAASSTGVQIGTVVQSPLPGLISFHSK